MNDTNKIQAYINNFRRHLAQHLKPGIGLSCHVYPVTGEGAVIEFSIGPNISSDDQFGHSRETVNRVLEVVPQRMVGGNTGGIKFGGTNISMEEDRIVIIKGEDEDSLWSDQGAQEDVQRIISPARARR
jgi:hypothetical protein